MQLFIFPTTIHSVFCSCGWDSCTWLNSRIGRSITQWHGSLMPQIRCSPHISATHLQILGVGLQRYHTIAQYLCKSWKTRSCVLIIALRTIHSKPDSSGNPRFPSDISWDQREYRTCRAEPFMSRSDCHLWCLGGWFYISYVLLLETIISSYNLTFYAKPMKSAMQILLLLESYNLQAIVTLFSAFFIWSLKHRPAPSTTHSLRIGIIQIIVELFKYQTLFYLVTCSSVTHNFWYTIWTTDWYLICLLECLSEHGSQQ